MLVVWQQHNKVERGWFVINECFRQRKIYAKIEADTQAQTFHQILHRWRTSIPPWAWGFRIAFALDSVKGPTSHLGRRHKNPCATKSIALREMLLLHVRLYIIPHGLFGGQLAILGGDVFAFVIRLPDFSKEKIAIFVPPN